MQSSTLRGHKIIWKNKKWVYEDTLKPIPSDGGEIRPCKKCGRVFEGSNIGEADPCLGELPGVDNACCGHGDKSKAYIRFTNGVTIANFDVICSFPVPSVCPACGRKKTVVDGTLCKDCIVEFKPIEKGTK